MKIPSLKLLFASLLGIVIVRASLVLPDSKLADSVRPLFEICLLGQAGIFLFLAYFVLKGSTLARGAFFAWFLIALPLRVLQFWIVLYPPTYITTTTDVLSPYYYAYYATTLFQIIFELFILVVLFFDRTIEWKK